MSLLLLLSLGKESEDQVRVGLRLGRLGGRVEGQQGMRHGSKSELRPQPTL